MEDLTRTATAIPQQRFQMTCPTERAAVPIDFGRYRSRNVFWQDQHLVGKLLSASFRGEVDDSGLSDEEWQSIARDTFKAGICERSSAVLFLGNEPACAMIVARTGRARCLVLAMTHPNHRGLGLAEKLLRQCLDRLAAAGIWELSLYVTDGNQAALKLYEKIGFKIRNQYAHLKVVIK